MRASTVKDVLKAAAFVAVVATVCVLGLRSKAEAGELDKIRAKAHAAGLPVTKPDLESILGSEPSVEDRQCFNELIDRARSTGVYQREGRMLEPTWFKDRAKECEPFMSAAETVAALERYRFIDSSISSARTEGSEIQTLTTAVNLFCGRAVSFARSGRASLATRDLSTAMGLINLAASDVGPGATQILLGGRQNWFTTCERCLGSGKWTTRDLESLKSILTDKVRELNPVRPMMGEFALRWEWIDDPQRSTLQANSSVDDDQAALSNSSAKKSAWSAMTDRAIAAKSLFGDPQLESAERLMRADKIESKAGTSGLSPGTIEVFISAHSNVWAQRVVAERLRKAALTAMLEALGRRAASDENWDKLQTVNPLTNEPIKLTHNGDSFSVSISTDSLNSSLTLPDSMVQTVRLDWPFAPVTTNSGRQITGPVRTKPD